MHFTEFDFHVLKFQINGETAGKIIIIIVLSL